MWSFVLEFSGTVAEQNTCLVCIFVGHVRLVYNVSLRSLHQQFPSPSAYTPSIKSCQIYTRCSIRSFLNDPEVWTPPAFLCHTNMCWRGKNAVMEDDEVLLLSPQIWSSIAHLCVNVFCGSLMQLFYSFCWSKDTFILERLDFLIVFIFFLLLIIS